MFIGNNQVYDLKLIRMVVISGPSKPRKLMIVEHLKISAKRKWDDWAEHKVIIRVGRNRNYKGLFFFLFFFNYWVLSFLLISMGRPQACPAKLVKRHKNMRTEKQKR